MLLQIVCTLPLRFQIAFYWKNLFMESLKKKDMKRSAYSFKELKNITKIEMKNSKTFN